MRLAALVVLLILAAARAAEAVGDPRLSIEERYPTRDAYVDGVRRAAADLVKRRLPLAEDAAALVADAEGKGIRTAP